MAFFSEPNLSPKRKFRWIVEIASGTELFTVAAKSVKKPNYSLEATQHKFLNHQFNYPNRVIWQPINITFVDHIGTAEGADNSVTSTLYKMLRSAGYVFPTDRLVCEQSVTKRGATTALGNLVIKQLSGDQSGLGQLVTGESDVIEQWKVRNAFITKVDFGDLSYDDDGLIEINCDIVYDWAEYQSSDIS